ncbi:MAG: phosphoribosylformylglycinamidine synthase subunit PurS [Bacteroidota bacterium]
MKYKVSVHIMPREEILDPQGKAALLGLHNLGFDSVGQVRIGKQIELELTASDEDQAKQMVESACKKMLANTVMEQYSFSIKQA